MAGTGINCGADCTEVLASGTSVALTATAGPGFVFTGWAGACTGTGPCTVTMNSQISVSANFDSSVFFAGSNSTTGDLVFAGGYETGGLGRGPAFQILDASGVAQTTKFALNANFSDIDLVLVISMLMQLMKP